MANNYFISYDLSNPGQNYEKLAERIKSLGDWARVQQSFWYLSSNNTLGALTDSIWQVMDGNDSLLVVNTNTNEALWYNLQGDVSEHMQLNWNR